MEDPFVWIHHLVAPVRLTRRKIERIALLKVAGTSSDGVGSASYPESPTCGGMCMTITTGHPKGSVIVVAFLLLVLVSPQARADSDLMIKQTIEKAAANNSELLGTGVRVAVEDRSVILFGSARLYLHRMLYEQIAWQTEGVVEVDNEIRVVPQAPLSDVEIKRNIWEIVGRHERFLGSEITVTVTRGAVFLVGTFGHPQDVIFIKKRMAAIEGVIAIDMHVAFWV